jgi:hypothetical protein
VPGANQRRHRAFADGVDDEVVSIAALAHQWDEERAALHISAVDAVCDETHRRIAMYQPAAERTQDIPDSQSSFLSHARFTQGRFALPVIGNNAARKH